MSVVDIDACVLSANFLDMADKTWLCLQDWARTHSGDMNVDPVLQMGLDPGIALVNKCVGPILSQAG